MIDSIQLCRYVLKRVGSINQLKLQKLIFYIQAFHLVFFDGPLVADEFEAWVHGPVSKKIWHHYKDQSYIYKDIPVPRGKAGPPKTLSREQVELIDEVLQAYSPLTSYQLEVLTHSEPPWIEARGNCLPEERCENSISRDSMKRYYRMLVEPND